MNEQSEFDGQNILGNKDLLSQGLADLTKLDPAGLLQILNDSAYTDTIIGEAIELTLKSSLSKPEFELFEGLVETILGSESTSASVPGSDNYAIFAEGQLVVKGNSDFDGDPLNPRDDAKIYAADGFNLKSSSTFPILRNDLGEPILNEKDRRQLVEGAVVVTDGYKVNAKNNNYSGLIPPQVVAAQTLEIPVYGDLVADELANRISPDTEPVIFNVRQNKIKNAKDWNNLFPSGGTIDQPVYVRVVGGKLDIPNNVDLSNYAIIVEKGDIKFKGNNNNLDNVLLQAESGKLEAKKLEANNTFLLASDKIDFKGATQFTGANLIANGKGKIGFNSTVTTPNETDSLRVISADDIKLKSQSSVRGQLLAQDDLNVKGDSTFYGLLGAKDNITFNGGVDVYAMYDEPEASIESVTVTEGDSGTVAELTVSLASESSSIVTVDYATSDDTAVAGEDYQTTTGTLTFAPGEMSSTVEIPLVGDDVYEADEAFTVELTNPDGITLANNTATVEIANDDQLPQITVANVEVVEANDTAEFTLSLGNASSFPVTVDYATVDGSALGGEDYQASSGILTFEPEEMSKTIAVELIDDSIYELTEAFTLNLSNPSQATIASASAKATIVDNDELPALSINSVVVDEGRETSANFDFEVTLDQPAAVPVKVEYLLMDSTTTELGAFAAKGAITLAPGETSQTIASIDVADDNIDEPDEIYTVELSNPLNASILNGQGTATITDNDEPPTVAIGNITPSELDEGTNSAVFTASLDSPSGRRITVDYSTVDDTASGTLTFEPGETSKTVEMAITGDRIFESNEFTINLSNPAFVTIA